MEKVFIPFVFTLPGHPVLGPKVVCLPGLAHPNVFYGMASDLRSRNIYYVKG